ncbi:MAG: hypothetical protein K6G56_07390 [Clostridiales bacterium]|nr:hypothetical protein [Clostridiales bacterium]
MKSRRKPIALFFSAALAAVTVLAAVRSVRTEKRYEGEGGLAGAAGLLEFIAFVPLMAAVGGLALVCAYFAASEKKSPGRTAANASLAAVSLAAGTFSALTVSGVCLFPAKGAVSFILILPLVLLAILSAAR